MELKRIRLRNLVNKEFSFYPKKIINDEYEMINRYDSDEEEPREEDIESQNDEGYDLPIPKENKREISSNENDQSRQGLELNDMSQISALSVTQNEKQNFEDADHRINQNGSNLYSRSASRKSGNDSAFNFEIIDGDFIDKEILSILEFHCFSSKNEPSFVQDFQNFTKNFTEKFLLKINYDSLESVMFWVNSLQNFFSSSLLNYGEHLDNNQEMNRYLNSLISESEKLLGWFLKFNIEYDKTFKPQKFTSNNSSNRVNTKDENTTIKQKLSRIKFYLLKLSDYLFDYLSKSNRFDAQSNLLNYIIELLTEYSTANQLDNYNNSNHCHIYFNPSLWKSNILSILINISKLFHKKEDSQVFVSYNKVGLKFSNDQKKNIFNSCFSLLKNPMLSNVWIIAIDIICNIIRSSTGNEFNEKFIEYMITLFKEFTDYYSIPNEKCYLLERKVLNSLKNYFGIYKCLNGDTMSIYTLLFLKFFSIIYTKDIENGKENETISQDKIFPKTFECFIFKILEAKQNNLLLAIFCLLDDMLNIKYSIEFSINLILLTNMFVFFSNILTAEFELNHKKFFFNCIDFIYENLFNDFQKFKDMYHCFAGKGNDIYGKCECFSCCNVSRSILKDSLYYVCSLCNVRTNLTLQIINPEDDTNKDICGFCNMKKFFDSVAGEIFENKQKLTEKDNQKKINNLSKKKNRNKKFENKIDQVEENNDEDTKINLNNNSSSSINESEQDDYHKFMKYQALLYKNSCTFIQSNILNFLIVSNKNEISSFSSNLDLSFQIFLSIIISEQKIKIDLRDNFLSEAFSFYENQKGRIFNQLPDLSIDPSTLNYFYFYYFYINFLYSGQLRTLDILFNQNSISIPWNIRLKSLKILEKFIIFEGDKKLFLNFQFDLFCSLLSDSSYYIREYALEILFKLYKFNKIEKNVLISTLFENVNEVSYLIRKRIVKALINLVLEEKDRNLEIFKTVNFVFLNKLMDHSESNKIKNIIYDFYHQVFSKSNKKNYENFNDVIEVLIEILEENEDIMSNSTNSSLLYEHVKNLFHIIIEDKKLNQKYLNSITDYIFENYIFTSESQTKLIQALSLIKIISVYHQESISIYFEFLIEFLKPTEQSKKSDIGLIETKLDNKIKQIVCEIISNVLNNDSSKIKNKFILILENYLIILVVSKPSHVMISSLDCYFKILNKNIVSFDKIRELVCKNYLFLKSNAKPKEIPVSNNNGRKRFSLEQETTSQVPVAILSKSLILLAYVAYCSSNEQLRKFFDFMDCHKIFLQSSKDDSLEKIICENIFAIYRQFCLYYNKVEVNSNNLKDKNDNNNNTSNMSKTKCMDRLVKFQAFEALGFLFVRFQYKLMHSRDIIESIIKDIQTDEEKLIILRTFSNFFNKIEANIKLSSIQNNLSNQIESKEDYGNSHLFFENFIQDISKFLTIEHNTTVRLQSIHLLKQIIESGNISVHNVLPSLFSSLFDYKNDIRHIAANLLEKIIKMSKEKFLTQMKDCLKVAFNFQKKIYVEPSLINSFVKDRSEQKANEFISTNENVFELLSYKISKSLKDESFNKKILMKFIQVFQEITNFDNISFTNYEESLTRFEFFAFVCDLIADYKFSNSLDILFIFENLFKDFETQYLVFKTKLKDLKSSQKFDDRIILHFLICSLQISMFKFLTAKYENFDMFETCIFERKDIDGIIYKIENENENASNKRNKKDMEKFHKLTINKEFRNFKFFQFYKAFTIFYKKIFKLITRRNSKISNSEMKNQEILKLLGLIKEFYKLKNSDVRQCLSKLKKKMNKLDEEKQTEYLFTLLFKEEMDFSEKEIKENITEHAKKKPALTEIKNNKRRVSLFEKSDIESDEEYSDKNEKYNLASREESSEFKNSENRNEVGSKAIKKPFKPKNKIEQKQFNKNDQHGKKKKKLSLR